MDAYPPKMNHFLLSAASEICDGLVPLAVQFKTYVSLQSCMHFIEISSNKKLNGLNFDP